MSDYVGSTTIMTTTSLSLDIGALYSFFLMKGTKQTLPDYTWKQVFYNIEDSLKAYPRRPRKVRFQLLFLLCIGCQEKFMGIGRAFPLPEIYESVMPCKEADGLHSILQYISSCISWANNRSVLLIPCFIFIAFNLDDKNTHQKSNGTTCKKYKIQNNTAIVDNITSKRRRMLMCVYE